MNAWQIEVMNHDAEQMAQAVAAEEWERLNAADPIAELLKATAKDMEEPIEALGKAIEELLKASAYLYDTPVIAKVDSYVDSLENIKIDLKMMKEHWERGERE